MRLFFGRAQRDHNDDYYDCAQQIQVFDPEKALMTYQFGTMTARHYFCSRCGFHTFVETRLNPGHYRINLGCDDDIDAMRLPEELYDGKSL